MDLLPALLEWYQKEAAISYKNIYPGLGYTNTNINCVFGMMYEMAMVLKSFEEEKDTDLQIHIGNTAFYLAAFCDNNNIKLCELISQQTDLKAAQKETDKYLFEEFTEHLRAELTKNIEWDQRVKCMLVLKIYLQIFPPGATDYNFTDLILRQNINNLIG